MADTFKEKVDPEGKDYELVVRVKTNRQENFDNFMKEIQELVKLHKVELGGILQLKSVLEQAIVNEAISTAVGATLQEIAKRGANEMGRPVMRSLLVPPESMKKEGGG